MARLLLLTLSATLLTGCPRPSSGLGAGNSLLREAIAIKTTDPQHAIQLLEKALEGNPRLARAHLLLGNLYYQSATNQVAAIYHFQKYLELEPNSDWRTDLERQIAQSKEDLAREGWADVPEGVARKQIQSLNRKIQSLLAEKEALLREKTNLLARITELKNQLQGRAAEGRATASPSPRRPTASSPPGARAATPRQYTIRPKDTLYRIAKAHGISLEALRAANPGINPQRLKVGQVINLPASSR